MSKAREALREALYGTGVVQPVSADGRGGAVSFLCRQVPGQEAAWLKTVDTLLATAEDAGIDIHVCRRYVRREGRMVFGWFIGVEAKNAASLVTATETLAAVLSNMKTPLPAAPTVGTQPRYDTDRQVMGRVLRGEDISSLTNARPRAPERRGPDPVAPPAVIPRLRVIAQEVDDKGQQMEITEMPIPHMYKDLNVPNEKGKGAKATVGD